MKLLCKTEEQLPPRNIDLRPDSRKVQGRFLSFGDLQEISEQQRQKQRCRTPTLPLSASRNGSLIHTGAKTTVCIMVCC